MMPELIELERISSASSVFALSNELVLVPLWQS